MVLVGDVVPQDSQFESPDFGNDLVLANLEGPVCRDGLSPIEKVGSHLHSAPFGLKGRWAFTLANNHLMDFKVEGMHETIAFLRGQGFSFGGAGENVAEARRTLWLSESGKTIAVICCCEHQFGFAGPNIPGVAAQGSWVLDSIRFARAQGADIVIVSSHAGSESTKLVSPRMQALYHDWIDAGADVIHGHHAHVPQGWEVYKGKPIFYGLGNFIVKNDDWSDNKDQLWSLVVKIDVSGDMLQWWVKPYGKVPESWQSYIDDAKFIFDDAEVMKKRWRDEAIAQYCRYYKPFLDFSIRQLVYSIIHPKRMRLIRENFSRCENHLDVIEVAKEAR